MLARSARSVVADEQTAGQGRHGHSWHSEAGERHLLLDRARAGAAAHAGARPRHRRGHRAATGMPATSAGPTTSCSAIKKVAGILVQLVGRQRHRGHRHQCEPDRISHRSLRTGHLSAHLHAGRDFVAEDILLALLPAVDTDRHTGYQRDDPPPVHPRFQSTPPARRVTVDQPTA